MSEITTVGLDLAKNVFQVHGADAVGQAVVTVPSLIRIAFKIIVCFQRHDVPLIFILYR